MLLIFSAVNALICGPLMYSASKIAIIFSSPNAARICGIIRLEAFSSQSFFVLPSCLTIASQATGKTVDWSGCTATAPVSYTYIRAHETT